MDATVAVIGRCSMSAHDRQRTLTIQTPIGERTLTERLWKSGVDDDHWAVVQEVNFKHLDEDSPAGEIVGFFLEEYTLARTLWDKGYEFNSILDDSAILWTKPV